MANGAVRTERRSKSLLAGQAIQRNGNLVQDGRVRDDGEQRVQI